MFFHTFELTNETMGSSSAMTNFPALTKGTLPEGDICSALARCTTEKSSLHMCRKAWTERQAALSGSSTCSTSYGWYSSASLGQGSPAGRGQRSW